VGTNSAVVAMPVQQKRLRQADVISARTERGQGLVKTLGGHMGQKARACENVR
jgi:hypothetical protein